MLSMKIVANTWCIFQTETSHNKCFNELDTGIRQMFGKKYLEKI